MSQTDAVGSVQEDTVGSTQYHLWHILGENSNLNLMKPQKSVYMKKNLEEHINTKGIPSAKSQMREIL